MIANYIFIDNTTDIACEVLGDTLKLQISPRICLDSLERFQSNK